MTTYMVSFLDPYFRKLRIVNTSEGTKGRWHQLFTKFHRAVRGVWSVRGSDAAYVAVNAGKGMWLTSLTAGIARLAGARIFLHHHSYDYVRERKFRMVTLAKAAGPNAYHIVLSPAMVKKLRATIPEVKNTLICSPLSGVNKKLLELPLRDDRGELVLGHLSNLSAEKGIAEVVDLALALRKANTPVRLIIGGPTADTASRSHLDRAAEELGHLFEYRGLLTGDAKVDFFGDITHFVFPSRYPHEAVPTVLYEAMAAGAVCVSTRQGLIPDQLRDSPSFLAETADSFVDEIIPILVGSSSSVAASRASREAFLRAASEAEAHLAEMVNEMTKRR